jgi:hypothetical protein
LKEEWDSEGEEEVDGDVGDMDMAQVDGAGDGDEEDDEGMGTVEDVFGEDAEDGDRGGSREDEEMGDS